ncbi:hypothetical protein DMC47_13845 [Nostoc sp. 3335mG]|nr:hypothetical protein DMC47_13845 [Nostoc sp. 3335mG]
MTCVNAIAMRSLFFALIAAFVPLSAPRGGETAWQEVVPGVNLRLVSSGEIKPDGSTLLGLEIDMPDNTKTYWRVPGETGLATELDFSGSSGLAEAQIVWPHPQVDHGSGYFDFVYFGKTLLPITARTDGSSGEVKVSALLGICSDICLPAQASFSLPLADAAPDRPNGLRIRQALAAAPIPWTDGDDPIGKVEYRAENDMLAIWLDDNTVDIDTLIAATDSGLPLFGAPQKSPQEGLVLLPILAKTENSVLDGQEIQLSFVTGSGAYELRRTIGVEEPSR